MKQSNACEGLEGIEVLTGPVHRERWRKNTVCARYFYFLSILLCPMVAKAINQIIRLKKLMIMTADFQIVGRRECWL